MIELTINDITVAAKEGETILSAATRAGIRIPTLCHIEGLEPSGACRLCLVEVEGQRKLTPSCAFPVARGMKVHTHSERVITARRTIVELLLSSHPDDCLYCGRNGSCTLQRLAEELGVRQRASARRPAAHGIDIASPALVRDPGKCVLCGRCVRVCEEVQGVSAIDFIGRGSASRVGVVFDEGLNTSSCVNCGQCVMVCPTGALLERDDTERVAAALGDPKKHVVVQHAPAVSVTLGEEFGAPRGHDVCGAMTHALRLIGFDRVFTTAFAADLTIMEEASELISRITTGGRLPLLTSCSPGWIKFLEQFYPEFLDNVSTCKSPQQMMGAIIKTHYADMQRIDPADIFSVSIMPCTAKKFEAARPEMQRNGIPDVDAVLTTRELARMLRARGINPSALEPQAADSPFAERSTAGKIFGATGGVMEAAIRTAHFLLTGRELENLDVVAVRGQDRIKEAHLEIDGLRVGVAVANGLKGARAVLDQLRDGRSDLHFVEVMTCPGGCVGGGGQPYGTDTASVAERIRALYEIDHAGELRTSHANAEVKRLYDEFLGKPLGHRSHELLHTTYSCRSGVMG